MLFALKHQIVPPLRWWCTALVALATVLQAQAAQVHVAVASNFSGTMQHIAKAFEQATGHQAMLAVGSTGSLHAQIQNGAPFAMLLAADAQTPLQLEQQGLGVAGTRFTYAIGRLALWSKKPGFVDDKGLVLQSARFDRIAIANPKLAPYGAAALQSIANLGLLHRLQPKFVQGDGVAQTHQFIATENAPLGFVALSQISLNGKLSEGSAWVVPATLHAPIRQDAILLMNGQHNPAATALMQFLRSPQARALIQSHGYD